MNHLHGAGLHLAADAERSSAALEHLHDGHAQRFVDLSLSSMKPVDGVCDTGTLHQGVTEAQSVPFKVKASF